LIARPLEYEAGELTTRPRLSVYCYIVIVVSVLISMLLLYLGFAFAELNNPLPQSLWLDYPALRKFWVWPLLITKPHFGNAPKYQDYLTPGALLPKPYVRSQQHGVSLLLC
jgi:hypothetical protein